MFTIADQPQNLLYRVNKGEDIGGTDHIGDHEDQKHQHHQTDHIATGGQFRQLGIQLLPEGVCLQEIHPPLAVVSAFRDVSSASKEKERLKNEAEAYYRDRVIKAAGEAVYRELSVPGTKVDDQLWERLSTQLAGEASSEINAARAFADAQQHLATGDAESFALTEAAHAADPQITEWRMYMEALIETLPGKKKLILDSKGKGRRHLLLGLRQNLADQLSPLLGPEITGRQGRQPNASYRSD